MSTQYPDPDLLWKRHCEDEERSFKEFYQAYGITDSTECRECALCDSVLDQKGDEYGICWQRREIIDIDAHPWVDMECEEGEF